MAKQKVRYTRRSNFSGARPYIWYAECLKNYYNAVDRTFCDAILFVFHNNPYGMSNAGNIAE